MIKLELNLEVKKCGNALRSPRVDVQQSVRQSTDSPAELPQFSSDTSYQMNSQHVHTGRPTTTQTLEDRSEAFVLWCGLIVIESDRYNGSGASSTFLSISKTS